MINSRLKYLLRKRDFIFEKKKERDMIMNAFHNTPWFTVPYLPKFADKFKEVIRGSDTGFFFTT